MSSSSALVAMRGLLLLGLVAYFAGTLGATLVREQRTRGLLPTPGTGTDPGIRVLLLNRSSAGPPTPAHDKLTVDVLTPCLLLTPDEPENPERSFAVGPGDQIVFRPDPDGIMISTAAREERWLVTRVRIQPVATTREPEAEGMPPESPARLSPTSFEAADRIPVVMLAGRRYRGSLEVEYKSAKELVAINALPMEAYIEGVIAVEMSSSYRLEALMAQAIASRSYAYATHRRVRGRHPYDVNDTVDFQEYRGHGFGNDLIERAVASTQGMVLHVGNQPFAPLFHASSGGWTSSIDSVLTNATALHGAPLSSVMPAQEDPWCRPAADALGRASTYWESKTVIKPSVIKDKLNAYFRAKGETRAVGTIMTISVGRRDPASRRVETVVVRDVKQLQHELKGHEFRMIIGPREIRSTLWSDDSPRKIDTPDSRGKDYEFTCYGYGHGVGMSQISAWAMAEEGRSHREILAFFYPGAELRTW